jgi:hypothetical protein
MERHHRELAEAADRAAEKAEKANKPTTATFFQKVAAAHRAAAEGQYR